MSDEREVTAVEVVGQNGELQANDASSLLRLAMERDFNVETVERLMAMREREMDRAAARAFNHALAAFQAEVEPLAKDKTVSFASRKGGNVSYSYASLAKIEQTIRPVLLRHGLSYKWDTEYNDGRMDVIFWLMHEDGHREASRWSCPVEMQAKMNTAQSTASTTTYGKRQSLIAGLGLSTAEDDVDGEATNDAADEVIDKSQLADMTAKMQEVLPTEDEQRKFYGWLKKAFGAELLMYVKQRDAQEVFDALERKRIDKLHKATKASS